MSYIELYSEDILDSVSLGKTRSEFNPASGDYIKVEIYNQNLDIVTHTLYSNRLLLKNELTDNLYIGEYHYHPENPDMGFCTEKNHTENSISNLSLVSSTDNLFDVSSTDLTNIQLDLPYKKQIDIFKDKSGSGEFYIKPNEILKLLNFTRGKYRLRIYFLRDIRSTLSSFLVLNRNNLIENGNFFAGLEATQTGDLDRSKGKNNFTLMPNPGFSNFVLEQDGIGNNQYDMRVTGIEPNSYYVFTCWVAWNGDFNGSNHVVHFDSAGTQDALNWPGDNTNYRGSWIEYPGDGILSTSRVSGLNWQKLFFKVHTTESATVGSIRIHLGLVNGHIMNQGNYYPSNSVVGRRYFTDLRFDKIDNFDNALQEYIGRLRVSNRLSLDFNNDGVLNAADIIGWTNKDDKLRLHRTVNAINKEIENKKMEEGK
jgi:hypothetical protein